VNEEFHKRLEASRKELLDLGLRNPLINHRKRAKQVKIEGELSGEVYRLLVTEDKSMSFLPLPEAEISQPAELEFKREKKAEDIGSESLLSQPEEGRLSYRYTDTKLQTSLPSEKLQARLLSIHNDARTYIEEQGINILYLSLGFLNWYESPNSEEPRRAPLILIPVKLNRSSAQQRFSLSYSGADIGDNLSLSEKLKSEFQILLPKVGDPDVLDVEKYFASVKECIKGYGRWKIEPNEITLSFFSFGKYLMYNDLDASNWPVGSKPEKHIILSKLLGDGFKDPESSLGDESYIDEIVSPAEVHQVKDADSTQILAILDVNAGRNLVLQGPPGTGKSQTITNIIAECIGNGRKVLFVSEKMAALEVVKRRLDEVGLGDAVLELHSHKTNKKNVLEELKRTLNQGRPLKTNAKEDIDALIDLRDKLNAYCDAVNKPIGNTKTNFIRALGNSIKLSINTQEIPIFNFSPMAKWSESDYRIARMQVEILDRFLAEVGPPANNPFNISSLTEFLPSQLASLDRFLKETKKITDVLIKESTLLADSLGLAVPVRLQEVGIICRAARRAMAAPHLNGIRLTSGQWQARRDDLALLINAGRKLSNLHAKFDEWLIDEAWNQNLVEERKHYVNLGKKWWRLLSGNYRRSKVRMKGLCRKPLPKDVNQIIVMIDVVLDSQKYQQIYKQLFPLGQRLFGAQWKGKESDWDVLEQLTEWIVALYRDVGDGVMPEGIISFLSGSPKVDKLLDRVTSVETLLRKHEKSITTITNVLNLNVSEKIKTHWNVTMKRQSDILNFWYNNLDRLPHLVRYNQLASEIKEKGLSFILNVTKNWNKSAGLLLKAFDFSWYNGLVEKAYSEIPSIKMFDRVQHEYMLEEFSRLDHLLFQHNMAKLALMHWNRLPSLSNGGELHVISREMNKKRRHMSIRKLIGEAGRAIQTIKPVFMMSPMSIATYIPQGALNFDLVVFDEASQVKPVDAFGAILRSKQALVVGDSKQLPPTNFFESLTNSDNDEEFDAIGDIESILSVFLATGAPERMLRWHYRSRNHTLIAVSNNEFYENRLLVFPSPGINPKARGLRLKYLPNTVYDRGKSRTNIEEAKAVAQAVIEHAKKHPDLSLGVVAFSMAQRDAIELQLERLRRMDNSCEPFFNENTTEPFFIKNLENVQGDERDVIFISIGYGKTREGNLSMSFGPLNRDGGERRLNVLISRSRLAMDVFSNFKAQNMDLNRTNARGVEALYNFLEYAESRKLVQPKRTNREPDSPFEEAVIHALIQHGIDLDPQVGVAGFFIDIGIKDPDYPGRYILGVECDGASYHSSRSARDRDRLRQEVLEGLGWRLHRIWSTDWYRNSQKELERVLSAIERAKTVTPRNKETCNETNNRPKEHNAQIDRDVISRQDIIEKHKALPYRRVRLRMNLGKRELHELSQESLLKCIEMVVIKESPVHKMEVIRRITEGAGLQRAGNRIKKAIDHGIQYGVRKNKIIKRENFLWNPDMITPPVRNRSQLDNGAKKFEWVAPEEMAQAILVEVENSFSVKTVEAISAAARLLGFHRVSGEVEKLFEKQISLLCSKGRLLKKDGILSIK